MSFPSSLTTTGQSDVDEDCGRWPESPLSRKQERNKGRVGGWYTILVEAVSERVSEWDQMTGERKMLFTGSSRHHCSHLHSVNGKERVSQSE